MHRHRYNSGLTTQDASDFSNAGGRGTTYRCHLGAGVGVNRRFFATNGTLSHHRWVIPAIDTELVTFTHVEIRSGLLC